MGRLNSCQPNKWLNCPWNSETVRRINIYHHAAGICCLQSVAALLLQKLWWVCITKNNADFHQLHYVTVCVCSTTFRTWSTEWWGSFCTFWYFLFWICPRTCFSWGFCNKKQSIQLLLSSQYRAYKIPFCLQQLHHLSMYWLKKSGEIK